MNMSGFFVENERDLPMGIGHCTPSRSMHIGVGTLVGVAHGFAVDCESIVTAKGGDACELVDPVVVLRTSIEALDNRQCLDSRRGM